MLKELMLARLKSDFNCTDKNMPFLIEIVEYLSDTFQDARLELINDSLYIKTIKGDRSFFICYDYCTVHSYGGLELCSCTINSSSNIKTLKLYSMYNPC